MSQSYRKDFSCFSEATRWAKENYIRFTDDEIFLSVLYIWKKWWYRLDDGFIIIKSNIHSQSIHPPFLLTSIESFQHQMILISCDMHIWVFRPPIFWTLFLFCWRSFLFQYILNILFIELYESIVKDLIMSYLAWIMQVYQFLHEISNSAQAIMLHILSCRTCFQRVAIVFRQHAAWYTEWDKVSSVHQATFVGFITHVL